MQSAGAYRTIQDPQQLEELLSQPTEGVVESCRKLPGDVILLGVGGKIGPSLAQMMRRASDLAGINRRIFGVSRFGSPRVQAGLESSGIETIKCDLLDDEAVDKLPDVPNVIYLAGMKFGSTGQEAKSWAMNAHLPSIICRKYRRSKIVAFSTGTVYGFVKMEEGGSKESDSPVPIGEYAMSCLGRERLFEYFSRVWKTPVVLIRLNYACDLRYGVLVDLAQRVFSGQPVDLTTGYFNTIWQGDANAMALQCFAMATTPASVINVTGPELLSVREVCETFSQLFEKNVTFCGAESPTALLSNPSRALRLFGSPLVEARCLIEWVADWVKRGGANFGKPTRFEARTGKY